MPPRKRPSATRRPAKAGASKPIAAKASKRAPRRRAKTQALAVAETVRREPLRHVAIINPLAALEPLGRRVMERQIALLGMAMAWSPAHVIVSQQAAFWEGFVGDAGKGAQRKPARKRSKRR